MDTVVEFVTFVRVSWQALVDDFFSAGWFPMVLIGFPILRYFFKKFLKSF